MMEINYAKSKEDALKFAEQNGYEIVKLIPYDYIPSHECACGYTDGLYLVDKDGILPELEIIICEACWEEAARMERI